MKKHHSRFLSAALLAPLMAVLTAQAQLAQSTFETGPDDWLVAERTPDTFAIVASRQPVYRSTVGNPGGHLRITDGPGTWYWHAPVKFLGDKSKAYGGRIEFDLISDLQGPAVPNSRLVLSSGTTTLYTPIPRPTTTRWTRRVITFRPGPPWTNLTTGLPATEAQMRSVLASLHLLDIGGEYAAGDDTGGLDNVTLYADQPRSNIRVAEVEVCWASAPNNHYRVEYRLGLTSDVWLPLFSDLAGTGAEMCVYDRAVRGEPQRFYRVICED